MSRECTFQIENKSSFTLHNPSSFMESGQCSIPPTMFIGPSGQGHAFFHKVPNTATGAVAVLTYDLLNASTNRTDRKVAVMFSVPFDYNLYSNWMAVGEFDVSRECDSALYEEMYYKEERGFARAKAKDSPLIYRGETVTITANMTDTGTPLLLVRVTDS